MRAYAQHEPVPPPPPISYLNASPYDPANPPGRGEAIQALNREVLIHRSLEVSPSGFITIISIIQGVALSLLAQNTFPHPSPLAAIQSVMLLLLLVVIFYWYLTMSVLLRWAPSFLDSFLPFVIASLEIPPAFFLGNAMAWNAWVAAFWLFASGGFLLTEKWSPPSHFGRRPIAHRTFHLLLHELRVISGGAGLVAALCAIGAGFFPASALAWGLAGALAVLIAVGLVVNRVEIRAADIHARFGVSRPPFN